MGRGWVWKNLLTSSPFTHLFSTFATPHSAFASPPSSPFLVSVVISSAHRPAVDPPPPSQAFFNPRNIQHALHALPTPLPIMYFAIPLSIKNFATTPSANFFRSPLPMILNGIALIIFARANP